MIKDEFLIGFLFIALIIVAGFNIFGIMKMKDDIQMLEKENMRLEQQVIDYRWQLEQIEYIRDYYKVER